MSTAADEVLVGFTRAVRAAGVPVTADRTRAYLAAVAAVGLGDRAATHTAGRATLCGCREDLERYDRVFREWFSAEAPPATRPVPPRPAAYVDLADDGEDGGGPGDADTARAAASADEVLRHRDVAALSVAERQRLAAMFATLPVRPPLRRAARRVAARRGEIDPSRTLRASLRRMGEPAEIRLRRRGTRPRRIVLLLDVSGSMSGYADPLLRLAHRVVQGGGGRVEVFTVGTRLTHITRAMRTRDPDAALVAAGAVVPDWSGGTRLGETMRAFLARRRDLARGAVVVVASDGWERGDPSLLAEQVARLHRIAHRVVWVNPHRGKAGYEPVQRGVAAVLPHVDSFLAGHSLATYADLMEVISDA
jgi:uncharacterized protein with von Willebrand factor type A (vWA) domain